MINTVSQNYKKDNPFDLVSKRPQQSGSYWLQSQNTIQNPDIVEINNIESVVSCIDRIKIIGRQYFEKHCREFVLLNFQKERLIAEYLQLYDKLVRRER